MTVIDVQLKWYEILPAANAGILRKVLSMKNELGSVIKKKRSYKDWAGEIEGVLAEAACAKALNLFFDHSVNTFKANDIGGVYQVRWASKMSHSLIIRPNDRDDDLFILVVGELGSYKIVGWMFGMSAKEPKYERNPNQLGNAWFVPIKDLKDLDTLPRD